MNASLDAAGPLAEPVRTAERLFPLDVLRGFALLGILHDIPLEVVQKPGRLPVPGGLPGTAA